ncbi:hypothetical protein [Pseudolabrys sp. FHR47]|uniref:hypothetical protein n=1 Tax=Pseudolabrys sp. FHR47 TaxID=2562284 RepID=UPI00197FB56D|nr:hypothetical protein [Pseudolabrys sp. FHR47]
MNKVIVSLFGAENFAWQRCLANNVVLTISDDDLRSYWTAGDRDGFVAFALANKKTQRGNQLNKSTASRWYGLHSNVAATNGDYWLHRDGDTLWWTVTKADSFTVTPTGASGINGVPQSYLEKPCEPWLKVDLRGDALAWSALHPKAKNFLTTQSTQSSLSGEKRDYALALLRGDDLSSWHQKLEWRRAAGFQGAAAGLLQAKRRAISRMVSTVRNTVARANGQLVERVQKNKELRMTDEELSQLIETLADEQGGLCALSGIPLQFDGFETDTRLRCSLDRKDSDGHYEYGNLQLVCAFINKWKSDESDDEFKRLLKIVRKSHH